MKRISIICILILVMTSCAKDMFDAVMYSEVDSYRSPIWFDDEAFAKFCFDNFDTSGPAGIPDGILSEEELRQVRSIDCSGFGFHSLRGIEIFPNLDTLKCRGNRLEALELGYDSQLRFLDCSNNAITELNVSVSNISTLFCFPMPDTVSGKNALEYLYVKRGQNIPFITSDRDKADPKRIPDETQIIAVPESKDELY